MRRILIGLVAMFSAALLAGSVAPALADGSGLVAGEHSTSDSAERAQSSRKVTINEKIVNGTRLRIWGKVEDWKRKIVKLQRKPADGGSWNTVARDRTTRRGAYEFRSAPVPDNCKQYVFRAKVKNGKSPATENAYSRC